MGLVNGSVGYLRFAALGELGEAGEAQFAEALAAHGFRDIDPHGEEEQTVGWVRLDDPFSAEWGPTELLQAGGLLLFALRLDTLKIPALTLRAYCQAAEREQLAAARRDKLTRAERDAVKQQVRRTLRGRSLPKLALVEVAWNLSTGEVRLFSTSRAVAGRFVELFEKTFAIALRPVGPMTVLWLRGLDEADAEALARTEPERLHLPPARGER
jgi:DNA recombination-dependent growth factor C